MAIEMDKLTEREIEVIRLLVEGKNNIEIGKKLYISKHTAKAHVSSIIRKLNVTTRTEIAFIAGKYGII